MACPWFYPTERLTGARNIMPLGDAWNGECRASGFPIHPDRRAVIECCNLGYAGSRCSRFPGGAGPDAVRFSISSRRGEAISVCCLLEKDFLPFSRVHLEFDSRGGCASPHPDPNVQRQARAYVEAYLLRRKCDE